MNNKKYKKCYAEYFYEKNYTCIEKYKDKKYETCGFCEKEDIKCFFEDKKNFECSLKNNE